MKNELKTKFLCKSLLFLFYLASMIGVAVIIHKSLNWYRIIMILENWNIYSNIAKTRFLLLIEHPVSYIAVINAVITGIMSIASKVKLGHCLKDIVKNHYSFSFVHVVFFYIVLVFEKFCISNDLFWPSFVLFFALFFEFVLFLYVFYACVFDENKINNMIIFDMYLSIVRFIGCSKVSSSLTNSKISKYHKYKIKKVSEELLNNKNHWEVLQQENKLTKFLTKKYVIYCIKNYVDQLMNSHNQYTSSEWIDNEFSNLKQRLLNYTRYVVNERKTGKSININMICKVFSIVQLLQPEKEDDFDLSVSKDYIFSLTNEILEVVFEGVDIKCNEEIIKASNFLTNFLDNSQCEDDFERAILMSSALLLFLKYDCETCLYLIYNISNKKLRTKNRLLLYYLYIHIFCANNNNFTYRRDSFLKLRSQYIRKCDDINKMVTECLDIQPDDKINWDKELLNLRNKLIYFFKLERKSFYFSFIVPENLKFTNFVFRRSDRVENVFDGPVDEILKYYNIS